MNFCCVHQTPTSRQTRYKEQVTEMRKGRNSGLSKEQKEKYMVRHIQGQLCLLWRSYILVSWNLKRISKVVFVMLSCRLGLLTQSTLHHPTVLFLHLVHRSIDRATATLENLFWRTSQVNMTWSSSEKPRHVHLKIW